MSIYVAVVIVACYASLVVELTLLRVPSVASSLNIWSPNPALIALYSAKYRRFFDFGKAKKLLLFVGPLLIAYAVYGYPLLTIWLGPDLLDDYLFAPAPISDAGGIALMLCGRVVGIASVLTIRQQNKQTGESFYLHTSGLFRWSRNPGLVGMYLFVSGLWVTMPSMTMLAGIVLYVVYMDLKVRMEEDFLTNKFGEPYVDYRSTTGRYLP